jgi:hypothetical protein
MLVKNSQLILDQVYARLSADPGGFNDSIAAACAAYGLPTNPPFAVMNWSAASPNFYFSDISTEELEKSGTITYPFMKLWIAESAQTGDQKFCQFSGLVECRLEVAFSFIPIRGTQNTEAYSNAVEDVLISLINGPTNVATGAQNQNWGTPVTYNGGLRIRRGQTQFGAGNYSKKMTAVMIFGLNQ